MPSRLESQPLSLGKHVSPPLPRGPQSAVRAGRSRIPAGGPALPRCAEGRPLKPSTRGAQEEPLPSRKASGPPPRLPQGPGPGDVKRSPPVGLEDCRGDVRERPRAASFPRAVGMPVPGPAVGDAQTSCSVFLGLQLRFRAKGHSVRLLDLPLGARLLPYNLGSRHRQVFQVHNREMRFPWLL